MSDRLQAADRPFVIALAVSLACHLIVLAVQLLRGRDGARGPRPTALEVIYDTPPAPSAQRVREALGAPRTLSRALAPAAGTGLPGLQIRVPNRALVVAGPSAVASGSLGVGSLTGLAPASSSEEPTRSAVVDLGNMADAAQGDPVLLSYFMAIRDQIQRTANRQRWPAEGAGEGLVYVSFVLSSAGMIQSAGSVRGRSIASPTLQEMAVKIVQHAGPFAPFPPSVSGGIKTIVIPLEFLLSQ
jgi:TonB family protein